MITNRPTVHHVAGRDPGSAPVVAVLTDGPTDLAVAARAAELATRHRTLLIAAAAVPTTGFSVNAELHRSRNRRILADRTAIVARVTPLLHATGVAYFATTLLVPTGIDPVRGLPVTAVQRLVNRFGAGTVVAAAPLRDPSGWLAPARLVSAP